MWEDRKVKAKYPAYVNILMAHAMIAKSNTHSVFEMLKTPLLPFQSHYKYDSDFIISEK